MAAGILALHGGKMKDVAMRYFEEVGYVATADVLMVYVVMAYMVE